MASFLRSGLRGLPFVLLIVGCASDPSPSLSNKSTATKLLDVGGVGQDVTLPFTSSGRGIRVEYRLTARPERPQVDIVALRGSSDEQFDPVSTATGSVSGELTGFVTMSLIPGRYRLRMQTDVPWTATVYESNP